MELANQQALLAEELTDEEVRDLLERLNAHEGGGSEKATVGAVVEATGADLMAVGRLLAEIRKEDFEEKFGLQLRDHGHRIETLEKKTSRTDPPPKPAKSYLRREPALDHYQQRALDRLAEQERRSEEHKPVVIVVVAAMILFFIIAVGGMCQPPPQSQSWAPVTIMTKNRGEIHEDPSGKLIVVEANGQIRAPTNEETARYRLVQPSQNQRARR